MHAKGIPSKDQRVNARKQQPTCFTVLFRNKSKKKAATRHKNALYRMPKGCTIEKKCHIISTNSTWFSDLIVLWSALSCPLRLL
jgi:hypothetical protein